MRVLEVLTCGARLRDKPLTLSDGLGDGETAPWTSSWRGLEHRGGAGAVLSARAATSRCSSPGEDSTTARAEGTKGSPCTSRRSGAKTSPRTSSRNTNCGDRAALYAPIRQADVCVPAGPGVQTWGRALRKGAQWVGVGWDRWWAPLARVPLGVTRTRPGDMLLDTHPGEGRTRVFKLMARERSPADSRQTKTKTGRTSVPVVLH